ncbi:hypothetical protein EDB84DRAFT_1584144, partial [Lactarius hengduanensis]
MPLGSKDIVLELPVAIFHPATLLPPPPEPYPYPVPDAYLDPIFEPYPSISPPHLPNADALRGTRAVSALRLSHDTSRYHYHQLRRLYTGRWLSRHIDHMDSSGSHRSSRIYRRSLLRTAAATSASECQSSLRTGCDCPVWTAHFRHPRSRAQFYLITNNSNSTRRSSRSVLPRGYHITARSVPPPPPSPTQVEVEEVLAPKPMPSPKLVSETLDVDPFAQSFGRVGTRTRSLSVVKLEEMAARAAAEMEAKAAADKTLPAPPVPSGKPLGHSELRRPSAKDVFGNEQVSAEPETVPRTPALSALSLLRPPRRHDQPVFADWTPSSDASWSK